MPGLEVVGRDLDADPTPRLESRLLAALRNTANQFGHIVTNKTGIAVTVVMRFFRTESYGSPALRVSLQDGRHHDAAK
jgi:hypothetical protein